MWIIPSNHPLSSVFAQDFLALKEDLSGQSVQLESSLMWRSKPSSLPIWLRRWNSASWLQHLFGRTLKLSEEKCLEERLTESWEDIPASRSLMPAQETEPVILDTFTRIFQELSRQQDLFGASLKTLKGTLALDTQKYRQTLEVWVTQLRQESIRRKKWARHTREIGCLSLQSSMSGCWSTESGDYQNVNRGKNGVSRDVALTLTGAVKMWLTPVSSDGTQSKKDLSKLKLTDSGSCRLMNKAGGQSNAGLVNQVQFYLENWSTPMSSPPSGRYPENLEKFQRRSPTIASQVEKWATPQARDNKSADMEYSENFKRKQELGYTIDLNSQVLQAQNLHLMADTEGQGLERSIAEGSPPARRCPGEYDDALKGEWWPSRPGEQQFDWEEPRTATDKEQAKRGMGGSIDGYNFREDLLRAYGNSVVEQTAEIAFIDLLDKHFKNYGIAK